MSVSSVTVVQFLDLAHLPRLPVHGAVQPDQRLLRHEAIIVKLVAGHVEGVQVVVEDIDVGHTDSVSE